MWMTPALWVTAALGAAGALLLRRRYAMLAAFMLIVELLGNGFALSHIWRHYMLAAVPAASLLAGYISAAVLQLAIQKYPANAVKARWGAVFVVCVLGAICWPFQDLALSRTDITRGIPAGAVREEPYRRRETPEFHESLSPGWTGNDLPLSISEDAASAFPVRFPCSNGGTCPWRTPNAPWMSGESRMCAAW